MKKLLSILVIMWAMGISGCASVPMASPEADQQAKSFETTPGKSNIYIYRNEVFGAALRMPVFIDGTQVGSTAANTYLVASVDPGSHKIVSQSEEDAVLNVDTQPGQNYYIWQEVKMGMWSGSSKLHLQSEEEGQQGVMECKLIQ